MAKLGKKNNDTDRKQELLNKIKRVDLEVKNAVERRDSGIISDGECMVKLFNAQESKTKYEVEYGLELIRDYLTKKDLAHVVDLSNGAKGEYRIYNHKNITHLDFLVESTDEFGERKNDKGIIVFDENGNVIHENLKLNIKDAFFEHVLKTRYDHDGYEVYTYIDDEDIIIPRLVPIKPTYENGKSKSKEYVYDHYKLIDGKYTEVNTIKRENNSEDFIYLPTEINFSTLKTNGDEKLCQCFGRLYSITEGKFLSSNIFDHIVDVTNKFKIPYLGCQYDAACESIRKILEDNNLLAGVSTKNLSLSPGNEINTLVYLDTEGNIVSDLYYYVQLKGTELKDAPDEIESVEVTTETYYDALHKVVEIGDKRLEEKIEKLRAEETKKNLEKQEKERKRLEFIPSTYKPKKK